jgi:PAS domain-containing protein
VEVGSWEWHLPSDRFSVSAILLPVLAPDGAPWRYQELLQRVYPGDRRRVDRELRASLAEAAPYSDEFSIQRPGGGLRRLHAAGRPVPGPAGEPERVRGITVDVTHRPR